MVSDSSFRFGQLVENTPDMVYRYCLLPEPKFEYINKACLDITGYSPEEHYADPFIGLKIVHPEDKPLLEAFFKAKNPIKRKLVMRWIRKDGTTIWTEQFNTPILNENGETIAFEGIARDITELVGLQDGLKSSLEKKQLLFNELQHRIKNSFLLIDGLFELGIGLDNDTVTTDALQQMRNRVRSIASLYSMLRMSDSISKIAIDEYCRTLIDSIVLDRVEKVYRMEPVELPARMITPLGIIINEMVTNSLKHAFKDGRSGKIEMELKHLDANTIHLRIGDNGPGFPPGFTPAHSKGLGTQLIEMLSEQLGAVPKWSSEGGLSLELKIPLM